MRRFLWLIISLFLFLNAHGVYAAPTATLYLSPPEGSYTIGENISVNVLVSSAVQEVNAVSGIISFPANLLELVNIQKGGSIVSLWVQEPSFDNIAGSIQFEGAIFNPVFKGNGGVVLKLTFRVKADGVSVVKFVSGSVLANDGLGTNVLNDPIGAEFQLLKQGSVVSSPKPKTIKPVEKQINRDVEKPTGEISILEATKEHILVGGWMFRFIAKDSFSGVDEYEISVDGGEKEVRRGEGEHVYRVRGLFWGTHVLTIKAVDKAGNSSTQVLKFGAPGDAYLLLLLCVILIGAVAMFLLFRTKRVKGHAK